MVLCWFCRVFLLFLFDRMMGTWIFADFKFVAKGIHYRAVRFAALRFGIAWNVTFLVVAFWFCVVRGDCCAGVSVRVNVGGAVCCECVVRRYVACLVRHAFVFVLVCFCTCMLLCRHALLYMYGGRDSSSVFFSFFLRDYGRADIVDFGLLPLCIRARKKRRASSMHYVCVYEAVHL